MSTDSMRSARHNLRFELNPHKSGILCNPKSEYNTPWLYDYKRNSFGFRCPEFSGEAEFVALGCSHTYGVGMPLQYTWPSFVCDITEIKDYVNLGRPGASIFFQVRLFANYIRKYGAPKIVLANFPDLNRYETVDDNGNILYGSSADAWFQDYSKSPAYSHFQGLQALNFLEAICKSNNIKLVWQFWTAVGNDFGNLKMILTDDIRQYFSNCVDLLNDNLWSTSHEYFKYSKKQKRLLYSGRAPFVPCCTELYEKTKDCFHFAYDRYEVPSRYENVYIEKELLENELYDTISSDPGMNAHLGAHSHWLWAKNLTENI